MHCSKGPSKNYLTLLYNFWASQLFKESLAKKKTPVRSCQAFHLLVSPDNYRVESLQWLLSHLLPHTRRKLEENGSSSRKIGFGRVNFEVKIEMSLISLYVMIFHQINIASTVRLWQGFHRPIGDSREGLGSQRRFRNYSNIPLQKPYHGFGISLHEI